MSQYPQKYQKKIFIRVYYSLKYRLFLFLCYLKFLIIRTQEEDEKYKDPSIKTKNIIKE